MTLIKSYSPSFEHNQVCVPSFMAHRCSTSHGNRMQLLDLTSATCCGKRPKSMPKRKSICGSYHRSWWYISSVPWRCKLVAACRPWLSQWHGWLQTSLGMVSGTNFFFEFEKGWKRWWCCRHRQLWFRLWVSSPFAFLSEDHHAAILWPHHWPLEHHGVNGAHDSSGWCFVACAAWPIDFSI